MHTAYKYPPPFHPSTPSTSSFFHLEYIVCTIHVGEIQPNGLGGLQDAILSALTSRLPTCQSDNKDDVQGRTSASGDFSTSAGKQAVAARKS